MFRCELERLDGNNRLLAAWRDLLERSRPELRLFGSEWYSVWAQTIGSKDGRNGNINVVTVYSRADGRLCGVLPVAQSKKGLLTLNATGGYFQPWRLILADQSCEYQVGQAVGHYLVRLGWNALQLGPFPRSHQAHQGMLAALKESGVYLRRRKTEPLIIAEVPPTWEQFQSEIVSTKAMRKIDYYARRLERDLTIDIRHYRQPTEFATLEMLSALARIEEQSWLMRDPRGKPRFVGAVEQQYWTRLINDVLAPNDQLDCWVMSANTQPISFTFALTIGSERYVVANSYDEAFADHRTGSTLYREMFKEGYSRGVKRYDFGTNELHYKERWGGRGTDDVDTYLVVNVPIVSTVAKYAKQVQTYFNPRRSPAADYPTTH